MHVTQEVGGVAQGTQSRRETAKMQVPFTEPSPIPTSPSPSVPRLWVSLCHIFIPFSSGDSSEVGRGLVGVECVLSTPQTQNTINI